MPSPAARRASNAHHGRLGAWLAHHARSFGTSLSRLWHRPWATVLTVGVLAIALALPLGLWLVVHNVQRLGAQVQAARTVTAFLKLDIDASQTDALAQSLRQRDDVAAVRVVRPEQSLQRLQARPDLVEPPAKFWRTQVVRRHEVGEAGGAQGVGEGQHGPNRAAVAGIGRALQRPG